MWDCTQEHLQDTRNRHDPRLQDVPIQMGQFTHVKDDDKSRSDNFYSCLTKIIEMKAKDRRKNIGLCYKIGCMDEGGDWTIYLSILLRFAARARTYGITVHLFQ